MDPECHLLWPPLSYNFAQFSLDLDWVEAIGSVQGAVNCKFEVQLGTCANLLGLSTSALAGDPDPYPWVFQILNAIPGSMQVSATG